MFEVYTLLSTSEGVDGALKQESKHGTAPVSGDVGPPHHGLHRMHNLSTYVLFIFASQRRSGY